MLIPPPVVVVVIGAAMWALDRAWDIGRFSFELQEPGAIVLVVIGLALMGLAAASFVSAKTTINPLKPFNASSLVTTGIYSLSRNPIYLGDLVLLMAFAVWLGHIANFGLLVVFVGYINRFQIAAEEAALGKLFGEKYVAYCSKVRRWV